jgi:hypothetical protein
VILSDDRAYSRSEVLLLVLTNCGH